MKEQEPGIQEVLSELDLEGLMVMNELLDLEEQQGVDVSEVREEVWKAINQLSE